MLFIAITTDAIFDFRCHILMPLLLLRQISWVSFLSIFVFDADIARLRHITPCHAIASLRWCHYARQLSPLMLSRYPFHYCWCFLRLPLILPYCCLILRHWLRFSIDAMPLFSLPLILPLRCCFRCHFMPAFAFAVDIAALIFRHYFDIDWLLLLMPLHYCHYFRHYWLADWFRHYAITPPFYRYFHYAISDTPYYWYYCADITPPLLMLPLFSLAYAIIFIWLLLFSCLLIDSYFIDWLFSPYADATPLISLMLSPLIISPYCRHWCRRAAAATPPHDAASAARLRRFSATLASAFAAAAFSHFRSQLFIIFSPSFPLSFDTNFRCQLRHFRFRH